jgi:uncharacterized membrane protein
MARTYKLNAAPAEDPFMVQFDKGVALVSYGLLIVSPFMVGLPAMASLALAFAHRGDAHPVMRSHYRFQSQVFWTAVALLLIGLALVVVGGGMEMTTVAGFVQEHLGGFRLPGWMIGAYGDQTEQAAGNGMLIAGVLSILTAIGWLMLASLWGLFKLVLGRPMGQRR